MDVIRADLESFKPITEYDYAPRFHEWTEPEGRRLNLHYVDEGSGPTLLLLHGQPMWGWLYHGFVPRLVQAGYRCVVPDYIGFGKSDKVVGDDWYRIERHCESIRSLIDGLALRDLILVVHDWGGPIGLRQLADRPALFQRVFILNTWLHHIDMQYTAAIRAYNARIATLAPGEGDIYGADVMPIRQSPLPEHIKRAMLTPFPDTRSMGGPRRFPLMHPYALPEDGNAVDQARCFEALRAWPKPAHVIFSDSDPVFPPEWGEKWAGLLPFGTFDVVATDGPLHHFLQLSRADEIVDLMLGYLGREAAR